MPQPAKLLIALFLAAVVGLMVLQFRSDRPDGLLQHESQPQQAPVGGPETLQGAPAKEDRQTLPVDAVEVLDTASDVHVKEHQNPHDPGDLQVLVVDEAGQPVAQIPVELVRGSTRRKGKFNSKAEAVSGERGLATLEDTAEMLDDVFGARRKPSYWEAQGFRLGVRAALPFDPPPGAMPDHGIVWLSEMPSEPVRLTIPGIGWVEVHMQPGRDSENQSIWPSWVTVRRTEEVHRGGWRMGHALEHPEQPHLLGPFGLGWQIGINLSRRDRMGALGYRELQGPTQPGQILRVDMAMVETQFIDGLAVDASGQPFVDTKLKLTLCRLGQESGASAYPTTDSQGRWRFEVAPEVKGSCLKVRVHRDPREFRGELPEIIRPPGPGSVHVGQVVLHPGKGQEYSLVSGRITDEAGQAMRRTHVSVYALLLEDSKLVRAQRALASMRPHGDGRFELSTYDEVASGRIRVYVSAKGYISADHQDVALGSQGLHFVLRKGGSIGATFRIEYEIPKEQVVIRLKGQNRSRKLSLIEFAWREKSRFPSLVQGDYGIRIEIRSTDWLLYETGAQVLSGQHMTLGEIDLRGQTRLLKLHLVDPEGRDIAKESFALVDGEGHGYRQHLKSNEEGNIWCVVPTGSGPLQLGNRKRGLVHIQPQSGTIEVAFSQ